MKKRWFAWLLTGCMAVSLTACSPQAAPEASGAADSQAASTQPNSDITVGFVVKSLNDQYWVLMKAGAEARAQELGVHLVFIAPNSESDVQTQVTMIEDLISQDVSALCVAPSAPDAVLTAFDRAKEEGIPVLAVDTDTPWEDKVTFIGTGNEAAARLGGEYAAEVLGSGKKAVLLRGRLGDQTHDERIGGWEAGLEAGGIELVEIRAADSESEKALNATQDLLQKYSDLDLICTSSDTMAQGAQRAVEQAGRDIKVLGFDGTLPVAELVLEGKIMATVAQNPYEMGVLGVENAIKAVNGESVEERIDSGVQIVDASNAQQFLDEMHEKLGD